MHVQRQEPGPVEATRKGRGPERIRSEARATLVLAHDDDQPPLPVILQDLSNGGAGMIAGISLMIGKPVVLLLPTSDDTILSVRGHVVDTRELSTGQHRIGIQFDVSGGTAIDRIRDAFYL